MHDIFENVDCSKKSHVFISGVSGSKGPTLSSSQSVTITDSELECLVVSENNNIGDIYNSDQNNFYKPSPDESVGDHVEDDEDEDDKLISIRTRDEHNFNQDDSGCATSLEMLSASCRTPVTALPSLNSLSLIRDEISNFIRNDKLEESPSTKTTL